MAWNGQLGTLDTVTADELSDEAKFLASQDDGTGSGKTKNVAITESELQKKIGGTISGGNLEDGSVTGDKLADGAVGTTQLADGGVAADKLASSSVTSDKIADGAVETADLADSAVTSAKIADGTIVKGDLSTTLQDLLTDGTLTGAAESSSTDDATNKTTSAGEPTILLYTEETS